MVIFINLLIAVLMTWFTMSIYQEIPANGLMIIMVFLAWHVILWLVSYFYSRKAFAKAPEIVMLVLFYLKELIIASLRVAYDVVTPKDHMQPAVIAIPLDASSDLEITLLANFITLTPGTLSIDVSEDRKTLYIHEVYVKDGDTSKIINQIKNGFEKRILKITR